MLLAGGDFFHFRLRPFGAKYFLRDPRRLFIPGGAFAAHHGLVAAPEEHLVCLGVVGDRVGVTARDSIDRNVQGAIHSQWRVFRAGATERSVIVAAPRQQDSVTRESDSVHTATGDLDDRFEQGHTRTKLKLRFSRFLDFESEFLTVTETQLVTFTAPVNIKLRRCHGLKI